MIYGIYHILSWPVVLEPYENTRQNRVILEKPTENLSAKLFTAIHIEEICL